METSELKAELEKLHPASYWLGGAAIAAVPGQVRPV